MEYFSASYTDFIKFNKKPNEDFCLISSVYPIFVVADGVTQGRFLSGGYAFPTGARAAAHIFCFSILDFLEASIRLAKCKEREFNERIIERSFDLANERIRELNKNEGIDEKFNYFDYDWFDTVGVAGFILDKFLYYGFVCDCGLAVFDKKNKLKFQTKDMLKPVFETARKKYKDWDGFNFKQKVITMHKDFRNNLDGKGYGSFSGEEGVKKYYQIGRLTLKKEDLIVFYSDGFSGYFQLPEFLGILRDQDKRKLDSFSLKMARENSEEYGTDRTLISIVF